jgi:crotonobetainyl-CoA:carnitine CoA-transferase CaiB-like acyl-CoA transferase
MYNYKNIDFTFGDSNLFFEGANRGKKSVTINLHHEEGRQVAYKMIEKSDVFLTNIRPASARRAKMDYATLSTIKPDLIYASVTSFGTQGPDALRGGFDYQGQGKSGLMYNVGEPDMPPLVSQFGVIDQTTAIMASYQVVLALLVRDRFGVGQEVDVSLLGTTSYMMYFNNLVALLTGKEIPRHQQSSADPQRNLYRCKDGKWIIHTQMPSEENWRTVCEILDHPELSDDARYNSRDKRLARSEELVAIFNEAFMKRTQEEWVRLFAEKDLVISPVNTTREAIQDPQLAANHYIVDYEHPTHGSIRIPGFPVRFSKTKVQNHLRAPKLGEHTDSLLHELLGYSTEEIEHLRSGGAI